MADMFSHEIIASLNDLELTVYNAILGHREQIAYMTIRELADVAEVSTTTVLRFCKKLNCEGYAEFKVRFKMYLQEQKDLPVNYGMDEIINFFNSIDNAQFNELIEQAVNKIVAANRIIFVGISTSASLGKYGARYFSNIGRFSHYIDDPYYPISSELDNNTVAIVLSVSGETEEILRLAREFRLQRCQVISITNSEHSSLAKLADFNISYHMPQLMAVGKYNITTQVPVIYILETIGRRLASRL